MSTCVPRITGFHVLPLCYLVLVFVVTLYLECFMHSVLRIDHILHVLTTCYLVLLFLDKVKLAKIICIRNARLQMKRNALTEVGSKTRGKHCVVKL